MNTITQSYQAIDQVGGLLDRSRLAMLFSAICLIVMAVIFGLALREIITVQSAPRPLVSSFP